MRSDILKDEFEKFETGKEYVFTIAQIGDKVATNKSHYRQWVFQAFVDGNVESINMNIFPWQAIPIVETLGYKKENGEIKIDYDKIEGRKILATVIYETYLRKDGGQGKSPKLMAFMPCNQDVAENEIPF